MFGVNSTPEQSVATDPAIHNDTVLPDLSVYFRKGTDDVTFEMNARIDPEVVADSWLPCASPVYYRFAGDQPQPTTIGKLVSQYDYMSQSRDIAVKRYMKSEDEAIRAISLIGDRLIAEAENRGWCDEFDSIIEEVNSSLPGWLQLPERQRTFQVSWSEVYYVTVYRTAEVTAKSEDDAISAVEDWDAADSYELTEAISSGNYDYSSDNNDYSAEEV